MDTEQSSKRIAKNTLFLYLRMALVLIVSLYTVRIVLKTLGVESYGIYSAVGGIIASLSFVTAALATASQRFFSIALVNDDKLRLNTVFNMVVVLYLIVGSVIILLAETVGLWFLNNKMIIPEERMSAAFWVFQSTVVAFFVSIISAPFQAMIIAKERMNIYALIGIIDVSLKLLIVFLLQLCNTDKLVAYSFLLLGSTMISQSIYVIYVYMHFDGVRWKLIWDNTIFKDISSFSGWTLFGSFAYVCNTQGVNLLLNTFFGPVVNAAYLIGNQVKSSINLFSTNFFVAARPTMLKEYSNGHLDYVRSLFIFSSKAIFILLFIFVFPIFMQAEQVLAIWLGEVGEYMVVFVRLMLIYAIVLSLNDPITTIFQAANQVKKYHLIVDGFTLMTLPLSYVAFTIGMSPMWAFIISIMIFTIAHMIRLLLLKGLTGFSIKDYLVQTVLRFAIVVSIVLSFSLLISRQIHINSIGGVLLKLIIDFVLSVVICWLIVLDKNEKRKIIKLIVSRLSRLVYRK